MKSPFRHARLAALCCVALAALARAEIPAAPQLLPADTLALVTVPDWSRASEQLSASSGGRLWADPAMRRFREHFETALSEKLTGDLAPLGLAPGDLLPLVRGQVTLAWVQDGWTGAPGTEPGWVVVLDARDAADQLRTRLDTLRRRMTEGGRAVAEESVRNHTFLRVDLRSGAGSEPAPAGDGARRLYFGQVDSALLLAGHRATLEKVVARIDGAALAPIGDDEAFRSAAAGWFGNAYAYGWARLQPVLAAVTRDLASGGGELPVPIDPSMALKALGLEGVENALFALRADREGTAVDLSLSVPEARRKGLFSLLAPIPSDAAPPPFVPASAIHFQRWRINLPKAWETLESTLQQAAPQLAGVVELLLATAGKDRDPDFDLRRSVFSRLGDDLVSYAVAPPPGITDPLANPSMTLVASPAAPELAAALKTAGTLLPGYQGPGTSPDREFNGRTIHALPFAPSGAGTEAERIEIAGAGGYVAVTVDPGLLEGYLRSTEGAPGRSLRDDAALRAAAQRVGGTGTGLFGYENQRESVRRQWEALRAQGLDGSAVSLAAPEMAEWLRFDLLPPFSDVARHFGIAVYAGQADARGLHLRFFSPDPRP